MLYPSSPEQSLAVLICGLCMGGIWPACRQVLLYHEPLHSFTCNTVVGTTQVANIALKLATGSEARRLRLVQLGFHPSHVAWRVRTPLPFELAST